MGDPPRGPGGVGRTSWRVRRGWETLPEVQEGLGGPSRELGGIASAEKVGSFSRRAGWGQEALQKWAGGVGRPSQRAWTGREALEKGQEGSGVPSGDPGDVGRSGNGWESFPEGWAVSGCPPRGSGGVGRPIRWPGFGSSSNRARSSWESHTGAVRGCEAFPEDWEGFERPF